MRPSATPPAHPRRTPPRGWLGSVLLGLLLHIKPHAPPRRLRAIVLKRLRDGG